MRGLQLELTARRHISWETTAEWAADVSPAQKAERTRRTLRWPGPNGDQNHASHDVKTDLLRRIGARKTKESG